MLDFRGVFQNARKNGHSHAQQNNTFRAFVIHRPGSKVVPWDPENRGFPLEKRRFLLETHPFFWGGRESICSDSKETNS